MPSPVVIATWKFGEIAVRTALPLLTAGARPSTPPSPAPGPSRTTRRSTRSASAAWATRVGTVQLDACVMDGKTLACGGVAGVENVRHVAALARRVMEKTPHVLLVGEGAQAVRAAAGLPAGDAADARERRRVGEDAGRATEPRAAAGARRATTR